MHLDFDLNGVSYRAGKLTPFQQFNIVRKLAPILVSVAEKAEGNLLAGLIGAGRGADDKPDMTKLLTPVLQGIADLEEADANMVLNGCLRVVSRQQGPGYAPVLAQGTGAMMFDDIDLPIMLQLVWKVLEHNLSGFFQDVPQSSSEQPAPA